jgi:hypothetical protein
MIRRTVTIGGVPKAELIHRLRAAGVQLNAAGERLFADERFTTTPTPTVVDTVELTVADLGLPAGGTMTEIAHRAATRDLGLCPLELGPHLRLQFVDQPEGFVGQPVRPNAAPVGSITIVSEPLAPGDDDVPKGFYLRRIEGVLWLRGYVSGDDHLWAPNDHLLFGALDEPPD